TPSAINNQLIMNTGSIQNWNLNNVDTGAVSGNLIAGVVQYNNIATITSGNQSSSNFIFANNAIVTGLLDGGNIANNNVVNVSNYTSIVSGVMTNNMLGAGYAENANTGRFVNFTTIKQIINNPAIPNAELFLANDTQNLL